MKIVFFGSSGFAVPALKALLSARKDIVCVVTQPDKEKGRGLHLEGTAVKSFAYASGLKIFQPPKVNTQEAIGLLKGLAADLFIVISYGQILCEEILNCPRIFAINVHASLLPRYRGAAPINWAIINGETTSGVTVIKMVNKMDAGPVLMQKALDIKVGDTALMLEDRLSETAAGLLIDSLRSVENNDYKLSPQDDLQASFAPKLKKEDGLIKWERPAQQIYNLTRGCLEWPGAFTYYRGKLLKIYKVRVSSQVLGFASSNPGEILEASKEGIVVLTGKGNIIIEELQIEGKRRMAAGDFIAGYKILPREILGTKK